MNLKKLGICILSTLTLMSVPVVLSSCGDDEPTPSGSNSNDNDSPDTPDTPTADKQYLSTTASSFINYFNEADQHDLIEVASYMADKYGEYDFPENFSDEDGASYNSAAKKLAKAIAQRNLSSIARSTITYTYNMARFRGVYEPDDVNEEWVKKENSQDVVFRFKYNGEQVTATLKGSGDEWQYDWSDEDYYYNEYEYYYIIIPKTANLTIKRGNKELLKAVITSNFVDKSSASVKADITIMNLGIKFEASATTSQVKENQNLTVNGVQLLSSTATATSSKNICSTDTWDEYEIDEVFNGGECSVSILNRVTVKGKVTDVPDFCDYLDYYISTDEINDPKTQAEKAAKRLNNSMEAKMYYAGSAAVKGTMSWRAYQSYYYNSQYYSCEEWGVEPLITFSSDGSKYTFENYFGEGNFLNIENQFEDLWDIYQAAWEK